MLEMSGMSNSKAALKVAIERVGSPTKLAAALGISLQAVAQWEEVPPLRVIAVERISGVPRHELRPDLYPVEPAGARA